MANELCAFESDTEMNKRLRWCNNFPFRYGGTLPHKRYLRDLGDNLSLDYKKLYEEIASHQAPIDFTTFVNWIKEYKSPTVTCIGEKLPSFPQGKPVHEHTEMIKKFERFGPVKVVCCVRDGREVISSQIKQWHNTPAKRRSASRWKRPNVNACLAGNMTWCHYMQSWTSWKASDKVPWFELHYDRLIKDRDGESAKLAQFLEVDQSYMKHLFEQHFKPIEAEWKIQHPSLNKQLPPQWRDMLNLYEFVT